MIAIAIFAATYLVVAVGHLPWFRLDRTGAALLGAALMVASGTLTLDEAYRAVDLDTLTLLLGMMIVVANLRFSGFFGLTALWVGKHARRPLFLLIGIATVAAVLSAFLVNDTVCLMLAPLVAEMTRRMNRNPVPYLLATAMASNIGAVATITGNPQNIIIGSLSHISYSSFAATLAPVAVVGLIAMLAIITLLHRKEILADVQLKEPALRVRWNGWLVAKGLAAIVGAIIFFFAGMAPAKVAIVAGSLLLVTRRVRTVRVMREIDWPLLLLFAGLFIVLAGLEKAVLTPELRAAVGGMGLDRTPDLAVTAAVLSNLVSNVPAVMLLRPFIEDLANPNHAWLVLAMAATLAGNFTILGSIANLIVVERAKAARVSISFWDYFRVGALVTLVTLALGILLLSWGW